MLNLKSSITTPLFLISARFIFMINERVDFSQRW